MCEHDLDTIQRLRESNKKLQRELSSAERKLSVARKSLEVYANKKNWGREPLGTLTRFTADTNGPYVAHNTLQEIGRE